MNNQNVFFLTCQIFYGNTCHMPHISSECNKWVILLTNFYRFLVIRNILNVLKISENNRDWKNDENLFIKLLIFGIRNLYEACSRVFHKIFGLAKEKLFDCSFSKFWGIVISTDPQNDLLQKRVKNWETKKVKKV